MFSQRSLELKEERGQLMWFSDPEYLLMILGKTIALTHWRMIQSCYPRDVHFHLHLLKTATLTGKRSWASWWGRERGKKMQPMSGNKSLSVPLCHGVKPNLCPQLQCPNKHAGFNSKLIFGNCFFLFVFPRSIFISIQLCYGLINSGANIFTSIFRIWRFWSIPRALSVAIFPLCRRFHFLTQKLWWKDTCFFWCDLKIIYYQESWREDVPQHKQ